VNFFDEVNNNVIRSDQFMVRFTSTVTGCVLSPK